MGFAGAIDIEIDTLAPNLPLLDLVEASDTGRNNDDNVTKDNTPLLSMTSSDSTANPASYQHIFAENFKYRIYDRFEAAPEILLYDSFAQVANFTALTQIYTTVDLLNGVTVIPALSDGIHNLKSKVEDRAGNISAEFLLDVEVDTQPPPVLFWFARCCQYR